MNRPSENTTISMHLGSSSTTTSGVDDWWAPLRAAGLESLQAAKEIRQTLIDAQEELRKAGDGRHADDGSHASASVEAVLAKVTAKALEAVVKVDETMVALQEAEERQQSEVKELVVKLGEQQQQQQQQQHRDGDGSGGSSGVALTEKQIEDGIIADDHDDNEQKQGSGDLEKEQQEKGPGEKETEALQQDMEAGRDVNATKVAEAAASVAEEVVQSAKEAAEQALTKAKKVDVAVRAVEIAKELTVGAGGGGNGGQEQGGEREGGVETNATMAVTTRGSGGGGSDAAAAGGVIDIEPGTGEEVVVDTHSNNVELHVLGNLTAVAEAVAGRGSGGSEGEKNETITTTVGIEGNSSGASRRGSRKELDPSSRG